MKNKVYKISFIDASISTHHKLYEESYQNGYILQKENCFIGYLFSEESGYAHVFGRYNPQDKVKMFINGSPIDKYEYLTRIPGSAGLSTEIFSQSEFIYKILVLDFLDLRRYRFIGKSDIVYNFARLIKDDFGEYYDSSVKDTEAFLKKLVNKEDSTF